MLGPEPRVLHTTIVPLPSPISFLKKNKAGPEATVFFSCVVNRTGPDFGTLMWSTEVEQSEPESELGLAHTVPAGQSGLYQEILFQNKQ